MWTELKAWWVAQGEAVQLAGLSDRLLDDMDIDRGSLRQRVMGEARFPIAFRRRGTVQEPCCKAGCEMSQAAQR
ncbi:hypothetical protein ACSBLW_17340 [Thioclava sp. FR2]|uniref:hypothetical protein n=1 Tax=Thioclava sp. FR2 TaxID=3445780 RepID=UPI003EB93DE7